jgi:DivIVA domain-containing protein
MRCTECGAETADAQFCVRCGAPTCQRPPGAGVASNAAGWAVPTPADASTARWVPPTPYVPGSGGWVPPQIRRALRGYAGVALGAFVAGGACAVAGIKYGGQSDWPWLVMLLWLWAGISLARRIRFSRLLRWPGDARAATVTAGGHGGRLLVLEVPRDGHLSQLEVRLPWWTAPEILLPGESVALYGREGVVGALLISSAQDGRAFVGTGRRQSRPPATLETPPETSGASLAEWAGSKQFSITRLRPGYSQEQVDAFLEAVRDTFLGVRESPLTSDEVHNKQFSTTRLREGYDEEEVDAFLEEAEARLRKKCAECGAASAAAQVCTRCGAPVSEQRPAAADPDAGPDPSEPIPTDLGRPTTN